MLGLGFAVRVGDFPFRRTINVCHKLEAVMRRLVLVLTVIVVGSLLGAAQTSLADAARQAKGEKKTVPAAKHVYTNDDVGEPAAPAVEKAPATEGSPDAAKTDAAKDDKADGAKTDAKTADKKGSKEDTSAKANALKDKIASQKKAIADQEREINVMEREHQIRVAEYYADAGNSLRTGEKWFQDEKAYQESLDAKKKALSEAKSQLDELSEQARKAGVPVS